MDTLDFALIHAKTHQPLIAKLILEIQGISREIKAIGGSTITFVYESQMKLLKCLKNVSIDIFKSPYFPLVLFYAIPSLILTI